jgi:CelD/BcsL family acetyltransferase involved in cellulose biosynthesis
MNMRAWAVALPKTRDEYDRIILKPKDRKEQRRKRRNLVECLGDVTLVHAKTESEGHAIFQALRQQRQARFKETGYFDSLSDPTYLHFYEAVAFEEWRRIVALSALKAHDKIVATLYALMHGNDYLLVMHCFESNTESLSPGIVAIDEMVTHLIDAGTRSFDFTIGNEGYKRQFGVKALVLYDGIYPLSSKGWLLVHAGDAKRRIKSALYPSLTACRGLVQKRSRMIMKRDWRLVRVLHPDGPGSKQSAAAKPEDHQPGPRDVRPDHARGKARSKPAYTH